MRSPRPLPALLVLVLAAAFALPSCGAQDGGPIGTGAIRIGAIYSLSGDQASLDEPSLRGAELAVEEINAAGGLLGRPVALERADAMSQAAVVAGQARRLYDVLGLPVVVGLSDTNLAAPVARLAESLGRVFVTSGATGPQLVEEAPASTFLACFSDLSQAAAAADFARDSLGVSTATLLVDQGSDYASNLEQGFRTEFEARGGRVIARVAFPGGSLDTASVAAAAIRTGADTFYVAAMPDEAAKLVAALGAAGSTAPILGGDAFDSPVVTGLPAATTRATWYTTHAFLPPPPVDERVADFDAAWEARYGSPPTSAFAALGYDAIGLVAKAVRSAGSTEPGALRAALESIRDYPGVTGSISYDARRHVPRKDVTIVGFEGGVPRQAAVVRP